MLNFADFFTAKVSRLIRQGAGTRMSDKEFLEKEIARWKSSPERILQIKGYLYYGNEHDILSRRRMVIGEGGELVAVDNLPNNRLTDNQYAKMVNQKANYLLGQPFVVEGKNTQYVEFLKQIFSRRFMKVLKNGGKAALNGGIAWLYPYYTDTGELAFRLFPGYEVLPFWKDSEHTLLDFAVRLYLAEGYEGTVPVIVEKVEVYDLQGIHRFVLDGGVLVPDINTDAETPDLPYVTVTDREGAVTGLNWEKIPLIPLKYNEGEIPLIKKVKTLQDGINVKVRYDGETKGGVETLEITVNAENYKVILEIFKKALIENAMGYDAKDDRLSGNPNQMNIQSMYSDIDLDANEMETELQAAFEELLWFINVHLFNTGQGDFEGEEVQIIFNRDILINESEAIENCQKSVGILSDETIIGQHPWIDDPGEEMERLEKQREKEQGELEQGQYDPWRQERKGKTGREPPAEGGAVSE